MSGPKAAASPICIAPNIIANRAAKTSPGFNSGNFYKKRPPKKNMAAMEENVINWEKP